MQPPSLPDRLLTADVQVETDLYCIHCGYNLRTLSVAGLCPECGLAVEMSLMDDAEIKWLRGARRGVSWLFGVNCFSTALWMLSYGLFLAGLFIAFASACFRLLPIPIGIVLTWAMFKTTRRSPYLAGGGLAGLGTVVRVLALVALGTHFVRPMMYGLAPSHRLVWPFWMLNAMVAVAANLACYTYLYRFLAAKQIQIRTLFSLLCVVAVAWLALNEVVIFLQYQQFTASGGATPFSDRFLRGVVNLATAAYFVVSVMELVFLYRCRARLAGIIGGGVSRSARG